MPRPSLPIGPAVLPDVTGPVRGSQACQCPAEPRHSTLVELAICAGLATLFEIACIGGFVVSILVWGTVPWL